MSVFRRAPAPRQSTPLPPPSHWTKGAFCPRGLSSLVEDRSPKPMVVCSSPTAPARPAFQNVPDSPRSFFEIQRNQRVTDGRCPRTSHLPPLQPNPAFVILRVGNRVLPANCG